MQYALDHLDEVPESTAANPDGGAARLDPDQITDDVHSALDNLLDEAELETSPQPQPEPNTSNETNNNQNPDVDLLQPSGINSEEAGTENPAVDSTDRAGIAEPPVPAEPRAEIDPEIAAIEQPRNLSEKNQNNWRKLQETATAYKKQFEEAQNILAQQQQNLQQPQIPQDYEELKKFKAVFDIKNDPEFVSKYDQPIEKTRESIYGLLQKNGATEEVINSIKNSGGPEKIDQQWWKQNVIDKLLPIDAADLTDSLRAINKLQDQKTQEIEFNAENQEQILNERKNASINWYKQENDNIVKHIDDITKEVPWARYYEVPQNATKEEAEKIQQHNASVADLHQKFNVALWPQNAQERASVAAAAVLSHKLAQQLRVEQQSRAQMQSDIKRLSEENSKLKASGKMPRQSVNTPSTIKTNDINSRIKMNPSDAIDLGLDEAGL
jgi:hypothetical protein